MSKLNELDNSIKELEIQASILKDNNRVLSKINEIKSNLENSVSSLNSHNLAFSEIVSYIYKEIDSFSEKIAVLQKKNESLVDNLTSTNNKLIRQLEDALISKLDRLNTDIQNAIRKEVLNLEKSVKNDLTEKFYQLSDTFKRQLLEQDSKQKEFIENQNKTLKQFMYVIIGLTILNIILSLIL